MLIIGFRIRFQKNFNFLETIESAVVNELTDEQVEELRIAT